MLFSSPFIPRRNTGSVSEDSRHKSKSRKHQLFLLMHYYIVNSATLSCSSLYLYVCQRLIVTDNTTSWLYMYTYLSSLATHRGRAKGRKGNAGICRALEYSCFILFSFCHVDISAWGSVGSAFCCLGRRDRSVSSLHEISLKATPFSATLSLSPSLS